MVVDMNMKVLIVDDYNTMLRILRNLLGQLSFTNIDEGIDGTVVLQKLRKMILVSLFPTGTWSP